MGLLNAIAVCIPNSGPFSTRIWLNVHECIGQYMLDNDW